MRIAILTTQCPFVVGGAELHARNLERALREEGHEAEIVSMPFKWYPSMTVLDHMLAARCLDVSEFNGVKIDLAICLKFPAYLMRHPNKVFWILHQHRQAYDMWDSGDTDLFNDGNGQCVREAIRVADNAELGGASRIFANSANVAKRLLHYNNVVAKPLYHPPPLADRLSRGEYGGYYYYPSRISASKRQDFVLRSLAHADKSVRVVFSGAPDNPEYGRGLMELAHDLGVADRVEWRGFVSEQEMVDLYAGARGVIFTPVDEDLGYIALEAMLAGKPLLTLSDAGEPAALVRDDIEGLVVAPEHQLFAEAMNRLMSRPTLARSLGAASFERYQTLDISWAHAISTLTQADAPSARGVAKMTMPPEMKAVARAPRLDANNTTKSPKPNPAPGLTLSELTECYAFGAHLAQHQSYYDTHWPRYQATLDILKRSGIKPRRILELGTSEPYVFTAFLKQAFPDAEFTVVQESPAGLNWRHQIPAKPGRTTHIDLSVFGLNIETTRLPFAEGAFDLVIAMEILEHLVIDPGFVFREAHRVLRFEGVFLVTTPNLVSLPALHRALHGASPYSFGVFVPWNGVYGRHNREYTAREVESLGRYAGFGAALLETIDVYHQEEAPEALVRFMGEQGYPLNLRGQNNFYLGRKEVSASLAPFPVNLFPLDPAILSGLIELRRAEHVSDGFVIRIVNISPVSWMAGGPNRMRLTVDRVDQDGLITVDALSFDLPHDIPPDGVCMLPIRAIKHDGARGCWHEIGLYVEGGGPLKGAGRTKTVSVFAEELCAAPELQRDDYAT